MAGLFFYPPPAGRCLPKKRRRGVLAGGGVGFEQEAKPRPSMVGAFTELPQKSHAVRLNSIKPKFIG
jgi:hypothetical protein